MDRVAQMKTVQDEALDLFKKKNKDYGDAFANYGPVGVIVRLGDKINRLSHVTETNITLVENETIRDTLIDLHNYAAMAIMLMDEKNGSLSILDCQKKEPSTIPKVPSVGHELYLEDKAKTGNNLANHFC